MLVKKCIQSKIVTYCKTLQNDIYGQEIKKQLLKNKTLKLSVFSFLPIILTETITKQKQRKQYKTRSESNYQGISEKLLWMNSIYTGWLNIDSHFICSDSPLQFTASCKCYQSQLWFF